MRWPLLLLFYAAGVPASCESLVLKVDIPAGYSGFQPAGLHTLGEGTVLAGSAAASTGDWRPLLVFVSNEIEYRTHKEIAGSGSELLIDTVDNGLRLYVLSNLRGAGTSTGPAIQSMKIASVSPEGELAWSSILGGQGFANAGDLSFDKQSATVAALGWIDDSGGDLDSSLGGWDIMVALFELGGRRRWQTAIGSRQDEVGGKVLATPEVVHVFYNSWNPKGGWDMVMARIDADTGAVQRKRRLQGRGSDAVADFLLLPDGNYSVLCTTTSEGGPWGASRGKTDIALLEVSPRGRIVRCRRFGWVGSEYAHRLLDLGEGSWGIVGVTDSLEDQAGKRVGGFDILLLTVDGAGKLLETRRAGTLEDDWPVAVVAGAGRLDVLAVTKPAARQGMPFIARFER